MKLLKVLGAVGAVVGGVAVLAKIDQIDKEIAETQKNLGSVLNKVNENAEEIDRKVTALHHGNAENVDKVAVDLVNLSKTLDENSKKFEELKKMWDAQKMWDTRKKCSEDNCTESASVKGMCVSDDDEDEDEYI